MNGTDLVQMAQDLTGRTTDGDKMLRRINMILRQVMSRYDFKFMLKQTGFNIYPVEALTVSVEVESGVITNSAYFGGSPPVKVGGYFFDDATEEIFSIRRALTSTAILDSVPSWQTGDRTGIFFRTDYSLENNAIDSYNYDNATRRDYGKLQRIWCDDEANELDIVTEAEFARRYGRLDPRNTGQPRVCTVMSVLDRFDPIGGLSGAGSIYSIGVRLYPITDATRRIGYTYYSVPPDITLTTSPTFLDTRFHDVLAWGAAYLTRLDDVDTSWQWIYQEYQNRLRDLVWQYGVEPVSDRALGPRDVDRSASPKGWF